METEKLAFRLVNDDESALAEIIDRFTPLVSTVIYNMANGSLSTADLEELTSDTFVTLWYHRKQMQIDKLKGFLCCIAKNKARDRLKSVRRHATVSIEDEDTLMIHVSPDFQCDQTLGFPTSLCVCWEQGKAWLAPNDFMMSDLPDDQAQDVLNACAEYGIRNCEDAEDFNNLLRGLGQNAMDNAWLPDDEEGMVLS